MRSPIRRKKVPAFPLRTTRPMCGPVCVLHGSTTFSRTTPLQHDKAPVSNSTASSAHVRVGGRRERRRELHRLAFSAVVSTHCVAWWSAIKGRLIPTAVAPRRRRHFQGLVLLLQLRPRLIGRPPPPPPTGWPPPLPSEAAVALASRSASSELLRARATPERHARVAGRRQGPSSLVRSNK